MFLSVPKQRRLGALLIRKRNTGNRWATSRRTSRQTGRFALPFSGIRFAIWYVSILLLSFVASGAGSQTISIPSSTNEPSTLKATADESRQFTWWLPAGADALVLPISAGIQVDATNTSLMTKLVNGSPWDLKELPVVGARYGDRTLVAIVPWPHYAELVVEAERIGIQFSFPVERNNVTPCNIVVRWAGTEPLETARAFREWRATAKDIGGLHRPRSLTQKIKDLPKAQRLLGAPHFYLWGPAMFSKHDVPRAKWVPLAKALESAATGSTKAKIRDQFTSDQRKALDELAASDWPMDYLTISVAAGIEQALQSGALLDPPADTSDVEVISKNRERIAAELSQFVRDPKTWGDGLSVSLLDELHGAGIEHAVLTLSDLYGATVRPDVVVHADQLGFLIGPYDSYHSVHSPHAGLDDTWDTAQFDEAAFENGRVIKEQGRRQGGFKNRGYHLAPAAAWPYVQQRVGRILGNNGYTSWFVDCDATGECFDDYNPLHPATRVDDVKLRRDRLHWLETEKHLVVGSEGGSVLFADVIHFGHGVHTPYIGHLFPGFNDRDSEYYLGRHWPPDTPEQSFKAINVPPPLKSPYFDPTVRIPLYQAALGDELIATHHWSFDSLKFSDVAVTRALMEILYIVPPMYHINREAWPKRKDAILYHVGFWSPLHRQLAEAPLVKFERLSADGLVQRTTYRTKKGDVQITVNFTDFRRDQLPSKSAMVTGAIELAEATYRARD